MGLSRGVVLVGEMADAMTRLALGAAAEVDIPVKTLEKVPGTRDWLSGGEPIAVLVSLDSNGGGEACKTVRSQLRSAHVPILGLSAEATDLSFVEIYARGGDDAILCATKEALLRRLRPLVARAQQAAASRVPAPPPPTRSTAPPRKRALVLGPDPHWRSMMARALDAGYEARFATTTSEIGDPANQSALVGVIIDNAEPDGACAAIKGARAAGSEVPFIVVAPPRNMAGINKSLEGVSRVAVMDAFAPPENVLFLANELTKAQGTDNRTSPRVLYGTTVAFRAAGREHDEHGFTYNVSGGGLYVRTLAPLESGQEVWIETWAPRSDRRVRLAGTVAWKRPYGPNEWATVPAGFGVKLTGGLPGDAERYRTGYEAFATEMLGTKIVAPTF